MAKLPEQIRAAVFDVDGTLLDSMPMWHGIDGVYAAKKGFDLTPEMTRDLDTLHLADCARYFRDRCGVQGSDEEIVQEILDLAREGYTHDVPEIPGARAFLAALKARGFGVAIATASDLNALEAAFERLNMAAYLDAAVSCDAIGCGKDRPDVFFRAAEALGVPPENCAVFEDSLYAAKTAKAAGFYTVGMLGAAAAYDRAGLIALCDLCIEDFSTFSV